MHAIVWEKRKLERVSASPDTGTNAHTLSDCMTCSRAGRNIISFHAKTNEVIKTERDLSLPASYRPLLRGPEAALSGAEGSGVVSHEPLKNALRWGEVRA